MDFRTGRDSPTAVNDSVAGEKHHWKIRNWEIQSTEGIAKTSWLSRLFSRIFRRDDGIQRGWKPLSISSPILTLLTILSLSIAAVIEVLAQRSSALGGLALSPTQDDIPQYAMLSYLYLPNIIAVLYSLIWSWVDLDVKRMQPWFELSRPEGATAQNSLFLDYPYDFVAVVPIKAARKRHWPVFFAGTVTVVVFWLITPLQSAIMGTGVVNRQDTVVIGTRSAIAPLSNQTNLISTRILNNGYSVGWLGQPFPPFITADYATLPFYVDIDPNQNQPQTNWTATTTKLWTELECWPAKVQQNGPAARSEYNFLNGQGCNATLSFQPYSNMTMLYVGYYSSAYADFAIGEVDYCPPTANSTHQFLAIWMETMKIAGQELPTGMPKYNITALYCQPYYYKQRVLVSVSADSLKPDDASLTALSPREPLTEAEFNSTAFEDLIATGMTDHDAEGDYPFNSVVEIHPRLDKTNLTKPVSNMVGYALAGNNTPAGPYSDPKTLHDAYSRAHKYLFSLAVNQLLVNQTEFSNRTATSTFQLNGIIVSRVFSAVVESLLLVVATFTVCLMWFCQTSESKLHSNPSSIAKLADIFRNSPQTKDLFSSVDHFGDEDLRNSLNNDKFRLSMNDEIGTEEIVLVPSSREENIAAPTVDVPTGYYEPIQPVCLRRDVGLLFGLIQIGAVIALVYLKYQNHKQRGLTRPSENFEVLQILENYLPTAFATFSEPFWVLLNRFLCLLQPFRVLSKGRSKASEAMETTYTSIPPQLAFWSAIKSRHFLLAMLCMIAFLSNVLAVGLGALFNESPVTASYAANFKPTIAPRFDNASVYGFASFMEQRLITSHLYQDEMYIAMANISSGTALPAWTAKDYFFQPHTVITDGKDDGTGTYVVQTRGFGVTANCTAIPTAPIPVNFPPNLDQSCSNFVEVGQMRLRNSMRNGESTPPRGRSAVEYNGILEPIYELGGCGTTMTFGWGRALQGLDPNGTAEASFVVCRPIFQTAMFDVRHDAIGNLISYNLTGDISTTLNYAESKTHSDAMITYMNRLLNVDPTMHNDTLTRDWMTYLIATSINSREFIDPAKPVPNPNDLIPPIESIYRQAFANLLSLNQQLFQTGQSEANATGQRLADETRIFMDNAAFIITMTVLCLDIVAATIFYSRAVGLNLPRMPTTIGSILAFLAPSRILLADNDNDSPSPHPDMFKRTEQRTYSFGRYIGTDQKVHVGIEVDPHVALIDPGSLREKKPFASNVLPDLLRRRRTARESVRAGTWL